MLEIMADRAANYLAEITDDPDIKAMKVGIDWDSFLDFFMQIIDKLMPYLEGCFAAKRNRPPDTAADVIARAAKWEPVLEMNRRRRRHQLGVMENLLLSRMERQVSREIDDEVGDELNNAEVFEACVHTIANSSPDEVVQMRAESARLREEAT